MRARPKISPKQPRVKGSCHQTARESDIIEPMASREITLETKAAGAHTRELIHRARRLPPVETEWLVEPPRPGWALGMVSWVALDGEGVAYMLQRGDRAAPVIALDTQGRVLRSWRDGLYELPHAIRVDPAGAIWTVDAATSTVRKFTPRGATLLQIDVGGQPAGTGSRFNGATDVAFGPDGRVFIADGYGNARILEYTTRGRKVREWGSPGSGPGQFRLPHSIAVDGETIYVADRDNGRIQLFDLEGKYLDEFPIGKTYSVQVAGGSLWASVHPLDLPTASPGWLVKLDRETGAILGYVEVAEKTGAALRGGDSGGRAHDGGGKPCQVVPEIMRIERFRTPRSL